MQKTEQNKAVAIKTGRKVRYPLTTKHRQSVRPAIGGEISPQKAHSPDVDSQRSSSGVNSQHSPLDTNLQHPLYDIKSLAQDSLSISVKAAADSVTEKAQASQTPQNQLSGSQKKRKHYVAKRNKNKKSTLGVGKIAAALCCTGICVFAIIYFVNASSPDISLRVAALQTGIDATYPSYIPRGYDLVDIVSGEGKISFSFQNISDGGKFSLTEETTSWDSSALLSQYVEETYGGEYVTLKEQGLTIYISGSNAVWVNGGIVYEIATSSGYLTKKQIRSIAVSFRQPK